MESVLLPDTMDEFQKFFKSSDIATIFRESSFNKFTLTERTVWKYSGGGLAAGRPLNSAMIFMAGSSGSGKSSTVNFLFDDPGLCKTSAERSQTRDALLIDKKILVPLSELTPVSGYLCFIDVPGIFDTDIKEEAKNLAKVEKAKNSIARLRPRKVPRRLQKYLRHEVYPNIILFVAKATDHFQSDGFRNSIRTLDQFTNIVDRERPNIIVVLTHSMSLAHKKDRFEAKLKLCEENIQNEFASVLRIKAVEVIPVENFPVDHDLPHKDGFYELPNGELSHHNLFKAMERRLEANQDLLGGLIIGRYFGSTCLEKEIKATVHNLNVAVSSDEVDLAQSRLADIDLLPTNYSSQIYRFERLGYGYCPVTEKTKFSSLLKPQEPKSLALVELNDEKYRINSWISVTNRNRHQYDCHGYYGKEEYQNVMKVKYSLYADLKVHGDAHGRWIDRPTSSNKTGNISFSQEYQLAKFKLDPKNISSYDEKFMRNLDALPEKYNSQTADKFRAFFSLWGTHLICEIFLGGFIQVDCCINTGRIDPIRLSEIRRRPELAFHWLINGRVDEAVENEIQYLRDCEIIHQQIQIQGGESSVPFNTMTVTPEEINEWVRTVAKQPIELRRTMRLYPYYSLLDDASKSEALREATKEYIEGNIERTIQTYREEISRQIVQSVEAKPSPGCFPKGTLIRILSGNDIPIESIQSVPNGQISTISAKFCGTKYLKLASHESGTSFVTFLHLDKNRRMEYLVIGFSNGKSLVVSGSHLIFKFLSSKHVALPLQAKYFQIGDQTVYMGDNGIEYPQVETISKTYFEGVFCPLTFDGTFFADGFLVTSYAHTKSFLVAQAAMLPLKLSRLCRPLPLLKKDESEHNDNFSEGIHPYASKVLAVRQMFSVKSNS